LTQIPESAKIPAEEGTMSLKLTNQEELFTADKMMEKYLKPGSPMEVFSREIYPLFKDEDFKGIYSSKGRNGISPAFLAMVTLLQYRESMSDVEAQDACNMRIDWKIALRKPFEEKIEFDPSTLCYFRRRLKENEGLSMILDKTVQIAKQKGFIKKKTSQRVDATHIIAHVNRISTTDLLFRTVKCLVEELEVKNSELYEREVPEDIKERYSNDFSSFGMSKEKRADKQAEIVEEGLYLKMLWERLPESERNSYRQIAIMETVFKENVIIRKKEVGDKTFIEVDEIERPKQTIFNPRDLEVKMGIKGKTSWVGSKCHIVETSETEGTNLITDMIYQPANQNDNKILDKLEENNKRTGIDVEKLFCDSNYVSGDKIAEYEGNGKKLMGYFQGDGGSKPEGFRVSDFRIDTDKRIAKCPAGHETNDFTERDNGKIHVRFDKLVCGPCPHFEKCVGPGKNKKRTLLITKYHKYIQNRRDEQKTADFRSQMKVRARVEGTISEAVRFHGLRFKKYKGAVGDALQFYLTGAAINLKRILKALGSTVAECST
jgi:transposase